MLYALHFGLEIDVGASVYREVSGNQKSTTRNLLAPNLVHSLCIKAGVLEYPEDIKVRNASKLKREKDVAPAVPMEEGGPSTTEGTSRAEPTSPPAPALSLSDLSPTMRMLMSMGHSLRTMLHSTLEAQHNLLTIEYARYRGKKIVDEGIFNPPLAECTFAYPIEDYMKLIVEEEQRERESQEAAEGEISPVVLRPRPPRRTPPVVATPTEPPPEPSPTTSGPPLDVSPIAAVSGSSDRGQDVDE